MDWRDFRRRLRESRETDLTHSAGPHALTQNAESHPACGSPPKAKSQRASPRLKAATAQSARGRWLNLRPLRGRNNYGLLANLEAAKLAHLHSRPLPSRTVGAQRAESGSH